MSIKESLQTELFSQVETLLSCGFFKELEKTSNEYEGELLQAVDNFKEIKDVEAMPVLVETRIDYFKQLELLGIDLDPAIFHRLRVKESLPYVAGLKLISIYDERLGRGDLGQTVSNLPEFLTPASPVEGISTFERILEQGFAVFGGGEYMARSGFCLGEIRKKRYLCLESYFGRPRISYAYSDSNESKIKVGGIVKR